MVSEEPPLHVMAVPCSLMNMDSTVENRRRSQEAAQLTPRERLERFAELQRRAMQLLAASPDGYRRYWERESAQAKHPCQVLTIPPASFSSWSAPACDSSSLADTPLSFTVTCAATEDADLIFERTPESEATLLNVLKSINACWISDER